MPNAVSDIAAIAQALADENRVRALLALRKQELCVCQLICLLDLAPSTVSKHLLILKQAGLVEARKTARWVYYRIADTGNRPEIAAALKWVLDSLARTTETREDDRRLREILATDLDEICCRIRK